MPTPLTQLGPTYEPKVAAKTSSFTLVAEPVTLGYRALSSEPLAWTQGTFGGPCDRVLIHLGAPREQSLPETAHASRVI